MTFGPDGWSLQDSSYDGNERDDLMVDGLGQLTDGIIGEDPESLVSSSPTNWVGWNNQDSVELIFEFNDFREFENCTIHVAHIPKKEVEVSSKFDTSKYFITKFITIFCISSIIRPEILMK